MEKYFNNGEIKGSMTRSNGYGSYIITAENQNGDTIEIHSNDSLAYDYLDSEDSEKQDDAVASVIGMLNASNCWKYKAKIKAYPTNIDLWIDGSCYHIDTDFQDSEYFESMDEAREWAEDTISNKTENFYEISNYDQLIEDMVSAVSRYIK